MKFFFTFLLSAILLLTVASCNRDNDNGGIPPVIPVSGVTLNQVSATLVVGDTLFLSATVQPADATNQNIGWSTATGAVSVVGGMVIADTAGTLLFVRKPSIAVDGMVIANSVGVADIVVTTGDGNHTATSVVTVTPVTVPVTGIALDKTSTTLVVGSNPLTLTATVLPENSANKDITWSSSNAGVATVDNNGVVTVISVEVALITATTEDGNHTASCGIAVVATQGGCNIGTPGWGESLGTVTFHSQGHNVVISGHGISQIWSGAVTATNCQKTTFAVGPTNNFNAECRSNPDFPGDLFSWCAVVRFADMLCPYPWRVPTRQDFINLDIAMGGSGNNRSETPQFIQDNYITLWGGAFSGLGGTFWGQGDWGFYWSQSERNADQVFRLNFHVVGGVSPQSWSLKHYGTSLRCVR